MIAPAVRGLMRELDRTHDREGRIAIVLQMIKEELLYATEKHPDFNSGHEGYAVILEEVQEAWDEIKRNEPLKALEEVVQAGAMCAKYLLTLGPRPSIPEWIAVDLDGTLARLDKWKGDRFIGEPVQAMVDHTKALIAKGYAVKVFTARASDPLTVPYVRRWLDKIGLGHLEITNKKDYGMMVLYDDSALRITLNEGAVCPECAKLPITFTERGFRGEDEIIGG